MRFLNAIWCIALLGTLVFYPCGLWGGLALFLALIHSVGYRFGFHGQERRRA